MYRGLTRPLPSVTRRQAVTQLDGLLAERPQLAHTVRAQLTGAIQLLVAPPAAQPGGDKRDFNHRMGRSFVPGRRQNMLRPWNTPGSPSSGESFALFLWPIEVKSSECALTGPNCAAGITLSRQSWRPAGDESPRGLVGSRWDRGDQTWLDTSDRSPVLIKTREVVAVLLHNKVDIKKYCFPEQIILKNC